MTHSDRGPSLAAAAGMLLFGLSTALLGAMLPILAPRLGFNLAQSGTLFLVLSFGVFLCVFGLGRWIDERGLKMPMVGGPALVAVALWLVTAVPDFQALLGAALILGLGGGALNVATNTLIADRFPDPRRKNAAMNWLGLFYGIGALLVPFGLGAWLRTLGFEIILYACAALSVAVSAYTLWLPFPPAKHAGRAVRASLDHRGLLTLTALLLFFQSGIEVTLSGFASLFLVRELGMPVQDAAWGFTLMWIAVIAARLILMRLALHVPGRAIVLGSALLMVAGAAWLLAARTPLAAFGAIALLGAGVAAVFPTVLGMTAARWPASSGSVFGLLLTVSRTGAMALPFLAGRFAEQAGISAVVWMVLGGAVLIGALQALMFCATPPSESPAR